MERCYNFPPHLIGVTALPCKTRNTEIVLFHFDVVCCLANKYDTMMSQCCYSDMQNAAT